MNKIEKFSFLRSSEASVVYVIETWTEKFLNPINSLCFLINVVYKTQYENPNYKQHNANETSKDSRLAEIASNPYLSRGDVYKRQV